MKTKLSGYGLKKALGWSALALTSQCLLLLGACADSGTDDTGIISSPSNNSMAGTGTSAPTAGTTGMAGTPGMPMGPKGGSGPVTSTGTSGAGAGPAAAGTT